MTSLVVGALCGLAALDAAFSGFRASAGRTGLIHHRADDLRAAGRGLWVGLLLMLPVVLFALWQLHGDPAALATWTHVGAGMLAVYAPYGLVTLLALGAYWVLPWQLRYLSTAVFLGPLTWARPAVALAGPALAWVGTSDAVACGTGLVAAAAMLAVDPIVSRRWYAPAHPGTQTSPALAARWAKDGDHEARGQREAGT